MIIKRYIANTAQEAMTQVKTDLGSDAVILNTRRIRKKGITGWFSKSLVEVTAAIDEDIRMPFENQQPKQVNGTEKLYDSNDLTHIEKKVDAMGEIMEKLLTELQHKPKVATTDSFDNKQEYYELLIKNEVCQEYAAQIVDKALEMGNRKSLDLTQCFEEVILDCLGSAKPIEDSSAQRRIILFVGPTGVGKTTTLAKLAAVFSIEKNKKVGLITADTYRIAAVDQLRVYAEILEIPMSVIYSPSDITEALEEQSDRDIVLIDTAGKSIKDDNHEKEIKEIIDLGNIDEIYLVISGNTGQQSCANIIDSYNFLPEYKLIFTKLDEVTTYGAILNCCIKSKMPLSYITTGQNVPADIEIADTGRIKDLLIGKKML